MATQFRAAPLEGAYDFQLPTEPNKSVILLSVEMLMKLTFNLDEWTK